jgi:cellulose synthase (UDP-forming)
VSSGSTGLLARAQTARPLPDIAPVRLRHRIGYAFMATIGLALAVGFGYFWFEPSRLPHDFGSRTDVGDLVLFIVLSFVVWHRLVLDITAWLLCGLVGSYRQPPAPPAGLRVAFITTFVPSSEPLDMLRHTVRSMLAADYPHDTWVLDEGNDPAARALCQRLGAYHFSRNGIPELNTNGGLFAAKTKGGNHNSWYVNFGGEYDVVAQIDTDFLVRRDFLIRTLGYFRDPTVAFVGTPQIYGNTKSLVARGAGQQTYLFYGPIMRAMSRLRMTLLIGANHVVRVSALRDIGWYQGHLTEDLATGKRFHAAGWRSVYVPEPLLIGEGPATWAALFTQQYRWASGCLNIFLTISPWFNWKMRTWQAFIYFMLEQFYFNGLRFAAALSLLLLYYATGWEPANIPMVPLLLIYLPLLGWQQLMMRWLQRFNVRPYEERGSYLAARIVTIACIPIYFLAFVGVLRNKRVTFKTTPKGDGEGEATDLVSVFKPHLVICAVLLAGMAIGWQLGHRIWVFDAWGLLTVTMYLGLAVSVVPRRVARARRVRRARRAAAKGTIQGKHARGAVWGNTATL